MGPPRAHHEIAGAREGLRVGSGSPAGFRRRLAAVALLAGWPATTSKHLAALRGALRECWRLGLTSAEDYHRAVDLPGIKATTLPRGWALRRRELRALFRVLPKGGLLTWPAPLAEACEIHDIGREVRCVKSEARTKLRAENRAPCHRVIGAGGRAPGLRAGLDIKRKLRRIEGALAPSD